MRLLYSALIACALSTAGWAQLSDGSTAPNWTLTDIDGNTHTLYDYIDQGKTVVLDFGATWCAPCWSYHQSGALDYFWNTKGPEGSDESMVFWIESDLSTGWQDLIGATGASQGDWVSSTPYPIIDVTTSAVPDAYNINYYPTLYKICTDYKIYEVGQVPGTTWENWIQSCTMEASLVGAWGTTCYGFGQGGAVVTGSGGYGSISFHWSNGQNGSILSGVEAGSYNCTAEDDNGREIEIGGIIVEGPPTPIAMTNSAITDLLCFGDMSGSISVTAQGGNGGFTYQWSNGASGAIASNLPGGNYQVTIVDANGCESEAYAFYVNEPPPVEFNYTAIDAHCDQNDGLIFVDPFGGTGPYELFADGGNVNQVLFQVDDLPGGVYALDVVDANGCVETQSVHIENVPGPELYMPGPQELTCANPMVM
ncbi:MAG: redoxin domain-containing protein, partial [Saprospiraceae bacterium]|nr:redoxin domain-containing protein [Saprospiraceae bacterium]